jgi:hypothetical protein
MKFTKEQVLEVFDRQEPVEEGSWRWGRTASYVVEDAGKHWMFTARFHVEEGLQDEDCHAYEVEPVTKTVTQWRRVAKPAVAQPGAAK